MLKQILRPLLKPRRRIISIQDDEFTRFESFCTPDKKIRSDTHVNTGVVIEHFDVAENLQIDRVNWPTYMSANSAHKTLSVYQPAGVGVLAARLGVFAWWGGLIIVCSVFMGGCLLGVEHPEQLLLGPPNRDERSLYDQCRTTPAVETFSVCRDGWESHSTGQGTCSWHGGVSYADSRTRIRDRSECVSEITRRRSYD